MMRLRHAAALFCALLCIAPGAAAQGASAAPLRTLVGDPIPYSIGLPKGWKIENESEMVQAATDGAAVIVGASDLVKNGDHGLPVSDAEARRIFTSMIMGSDSLLFGLVDEGLRIVDEIQIVEREIQSLGGHRAAVVRGRFAKDGVSGTMEMIVTVDDGILYVLAFLAESDGHARHAPLFVRIRESFTLPSAPAAAVADAQR